MRNIRKDFPILKQKINGQPVTYFDSAATTQKPKAVIDAMLDFYTTYNANIHRGIYEFSERATQAYEDARVKVVNFIGAADPSEVVFTRGTTEGINLVASTWGMCNIGEGDEILISELEHHSNLLPWQFLAHQTGATLKFIPVLPDGTLDMSKLPELITEKTKLVAITQASNVIGTRIDVEPIIKAAHAAGARVLIDAAQSVPHQRVNVQEMGCDFLAFSGHKMFGPTGIGVLYIKKDLHEELPPYQVGGGMVYEVDFLKSSWKPLPNKFEAGTPAIAQAIGLGAAVDYIQKNVNFDELHKLEASLCSRIIDGLSNYPAVKIVGPLEELKKSGHLISFVVDGMHAHDVSAYLANYGICVRAGHHCAQPLGKKLGVQASVRASFYGYNTPEEVDRLVEKMGALIKELGTRTV